MKIVTNVSSGKLGGITGTNLALFQWMDQEADRVVGIEVVRSRAFRVSELFKSYKLDFFRHYVVSSFDLHAGMSKRAKTLADAKKEWKPAIRTIKALLEKEQPDVVLLNGTYTYPWLLGLAAKSLRIPIVLRYAGVFSREAGWVKQPLQNIYRSMERSTAAMADAYIFPSKLCRDVVEKEVVKKRLKNAQVIANPVRIPDVKKPETSALTRSIAMIARWDPIKNFPVFFEIHKRLLKEGWPHQAFVVTAEMKKQKIPKTVLRLPPMSYKELWNVYRDLGLLIVPSEFETFSNVAAEAALAGTPVLVSEQVGFAGYLKAAGLHEMVVPNFEDMDLVLKRVKQLCGTEIPKQKLKKLRKELDIHVMHEQIMQTLRKTASQRK